MGKAIMILHIAHDVQCEKGHIAMLSQLKTIVSNTSATGVNKDNLRYLILVYRYMSMIVNVNG